MPLKAFLMAGTTVTIVEEKVGDTLPLPFWFPVRVPQVPLPR